MYQSHWSAAFTYTDMAARLDLSSTSTSMHKKITDAVTFSPNAGSVTSRPDDEWLVESSLVSEAECALDTLASFLPSSLPNCPCLLSQCFTSELFHSGTRGRSQDPEQEHSTQPETEQLEHVKAQLEAEIAGLEREKERLELVLEAHKPACKMDGSDPE
ncbi:protein c-Fos isoform X2 [Neoarius graeffei]|uniref:protein c-Fos isoform X2 n=1 Tax=Neoarius graeffei TaxID=443677 RepID=UPI00298CEC72|nr:protein c-Fos isoform X2 [Neoarius graeffei]